LVHDFDEWWNIADHRECLLMMARMTETEPSLLGISAHLMVVASKTA
jgi:hypothetical protein